VRPLRLLDDIPGHLPALAALLADEGYSAAPHWQGVIPDTGPWVRHHDAEPLPADNAWMRLHARLADLLHLALPGGEQWLAAGALPLSGHEGIAWVEMSRGLLVHWLRLAPATDGGGPRVAAARVLAPTDWNFHPRGVLAQALVPLSDTDTARDDACRLAVAFDPCVAFSVEPPPAGQEGQACTR
jgi:hypothetical protein